MPQFTQNPHSLRGEDREKVLEVAIGREVRAFRKQKGLTVAELADRTGVSVGMLSKIENGNTSPSLTTMQALAHALSVPLTSFFRRFEEARPAVHTKAGDGVEAGRQFGREGAVRGPAVILGIAKPRRKATRERLFFLGAEGRVGMDSGQEFDAARHHTGVQVHFFLGGLGDDPVQPG